VFLKDGELGWLKKKKNHSGWGLGGTVWKKKWAAWLQFHLKGKKEKKGADTTLKERESNGK